MNMKKISAAVIAACVCSSVAVAEQIKDPYHPQVNGSPITLMKDNLITQQLGGRWLDVDVWVGDFLKIDDNLFAANKNKDDEMINSVAAGFKMQGSEAEAWSMRLEGQIQHNDYKNFNAFDGEEGYIHANGQVNLSPALSFNGGVSFDSNLDNDHGQQIDTLYRVNKTAVSAGTTIRPTEFFGVDVNYAYFAQRRDDTANAQDYDENSISARVFHNYTDAITVYTQLSYAKADPKNNNKHNETDTYNSNVGFSWAYKDAANLFAEVGVRYMDFGTPSAHFTDKSEDVTRTTFRIGGSMALDADWKLEGNMSWAPTVGSMSSASAVSNYSDAFSMSAGAVYSPGEGRFTAKVSPFFSSTQPSNNEKYTEVGLTLGVTYSVTDMLNMSAGYRYTSTDYDTRPAFSRNVLTLGIAGTF